MDAAVGESSACGGARRGVRRGCLGWGPMNAEHIQSRLHDALHRGHRKATEQELAEVTAVVLAIVTEVTAELAAVIAETMPACSR